MIPVLSHERYPMVEAMVALVAHGPVDGTILAMLSVSLQFGATRTLDNAKT
ncbi:hypothetical protein NC653_026224 [Populus alba x Populus x berolinensis]|uniref:Uncharacterized protein n=1 Tax=Populus alba x Populus x berolinensis TaxID=444605 RepID=A0AAD6MD45_9ROSI|nr:hypothetical protein NC653_026224 [Populus alba x Populus x berolinensis]